MQATSKSLVRIVIAAIWLALSGLGGLLGVQEPVEENLSRQGIHVRPDPQGTPTRVELGVYFLDVMSIDDATQTFEVDLALSARWRDPRLAFSVEEVGSAELVLPLQDVWYPGLSTLNRRDAEILLPDVVRVQPDGQVTYSQRVQASLASRLDLREFPFDSQVLPIQIVVYRHGPEEVELVVADRLTGGRGDFSLTGWVVEEGEAWVEPVQLPGMADHFAGMSFSLLAVRKSSYFSLTMFVPLVLIVLMAWTVLWIDPSVVPPKVGISTASIFSLIAFRFSLRSGLPDVAYMTRADRFLLGATLLVFAVLGEVIVTARLAKQGNEELACRIDRLGRWVYLVAFLVLAAYSRWH
jgi:hypothetical protein